MKVVSPNITMTNVKYPAAPKFPDKYTYLYYLSIGLWLTESSVEVILAINRCMFFVAPNLALRLFGSLEKKTAYRAWIWMIPPTLWGLNYFVQEQSPIFSSFVLIEAWNPHLGYANGMLQNVCFCIHFQ